MNSSHTPRGKLGGIISGRRKEWGGGGRKTGQRTGEEERKRGHDLCCFTIPKDFLRFFFLLSETFLRFFFLLSVTT
jgi:hypothetical protein